MLPIDSSTDKVPLINARPKKINGTASEVHKLLLMFPIAVSRVIKEVDDEVWQMVLRLMKINSLVSAPSLSVGQVAILDTFINEYMQLRLKCFPNIKLRPKHHFLAHYPSLILEFGPLKHLSTL